MPRRRKPGPKKKIKCRRTTTTATDSLSVKGSKRSVRFKVTLPCGDKSYAKGTHGKVLKALPAKQHNALAAGIDAGCKVVFWKAGKASVVCQKDAKELAANKERQKRRAKANKAFQRYKFPKGTKDSAKFKQELKKRCITTEKKGNVTLFAKVKNCQPKGRFATA